MAYLALIVEDVIINKWEITEEVVILGRAKDCDIQIDEQSVSSKHARLVTEEDPYMEDTFVYYLEDLKSTNGSELNGRAIQREKLVDGDIIKIGFNQFRFITDETQGLDDTAVNINF